MEVTDARYRDRANVSKFSLCRKNRGYFRQRHALVKITKIFSCRKFPRIRPRDFSSVENFRVYGNVVSDGKNQEHHAIRKL